MRKPQAAQITNGAGLGMHENYHMRYEWCWPLDNPIDPPHCTVIIQLRRVVEINTSNLFFPPPWVALLMHAEPGTINY